MISVGMTMQVLSFIKRSKEAVRQIVTQNIITATNNQRVYESEDVIRFYAEQSDLQKPEATILNEFRNRLPKMSMLDIGVGAGRTTAHFAVLAKEYLGIDYSSKMIDTCLEKFEDHKGKISFLTADARTMKLFKDSSFDFVLFSFNGIDYMDHEERIRTLLEIRRIIREGGYFCFSTHNLNFLLKKCSIQLSKQPFVLAPRIVHLLQMRLLNKKEAWKAIRSPSRNAKHTMVNDGAMDFRLKTYHITPTEQLKQLSELGFTNTKMYSLTNGTEIKNLSNSVDHWIYYLSEIP
jgi:ubiquinone/menaquinone biosynthesis C-methylase UbiE